MPELPDVAVYAEHMKNTSLDKEITAAEVEDASMLEGTSGAELERIAKGARFTGLRRRGKYLAASLDNGHWVVFHFGMTGFLKHFSDEGERPGHVRVLFSFSDGGKLAYDCSRKFGEVRVVQDLDAFFVSKDLGPDAMELDEDEFSTLIEERRGGLKSALMDQSLLAGIGNVYSDEILFQASLHPEATCSSLKQSDLETLYRTMRHVMEKAIEYGADPAQMPDTWLLPHREPGATCPGRKGCTGSVEKIQVNGRSTYVCPTCQKQ